MKYMLDTNICIYAMNNPTPSLAHQFQNHVGELCISSITEYELRYGVLKSQKVKSNLEKLNRFIARLSIFEFNSNATDHAADIRVKLEAVGKVIGPYDLLIAGHGRSKGLVIITNNTKEFERVPGLLVEDWSV